MLPLDTEMPVVAWRPLDVSKLPEKELEPVPEEKTWPEVLREPPVMPLVTVNDLDMFNEPENELEPVPVEKS